MLPRATSSAGQPLASTLLRRSGITRKARPRPRYLSSFSSFSSAAAPRQDGKKTQPAPPSFSLSGAGFLSPFHIGVVKALQEKGIITDKTKLAGASGGALVAASTVCGLSPADQMDAYKAMSKACRTAGFLGKVRGVLLESLEERLPEDAHERANARLTIAVQRLWPSFSLRPELLSHFHSRQDLLACLLVSSHVPLYLDAEQPFWTKFRQGFYMDGGLVDLVPPVPGAIKICVFPGHMLFRSDLHVTPHLLGADFPFSMREIMRWAFVAPPDAVADELVLLGKQAALEWLKTGGIEEGREIDVTEAMDDDVAGSSSSSGLSLHAVPGKLEGGPLTQQHAHSVPPLAEPAGSGVRPEEKWKGG